MARKLDKKVIQTRLKENKAIMRDSKKVVSASMADATKGSDFDVNNARQTFSTFIKAAVAMKADTLKLASIKD